ncbi:MAG TPA: CZB domain-containing protein [Rhodocyclaceae bacterium]|nr:CZB domain-containing protein [Rhodocyclaceae bacterium]
MGVLDFFRFSFFSGRDTSGMEDQDLDFAKWVKAHQDWRARLIAYINGSSGEALDENVVCQDDRCELGKWIYRRGIRYYGDLPVFQKLKGQHAEFHVSAGRVVSTFKARGPAAAKKALHSEFDLNSMRVIRGLEALERQVKES